VGAVELSRLQFGLTISFHFVFPAITIGLAGVIAIVETLRWWTKRDVYDRMSVFLARLFGVTFVVGVVSGLVMEFEFGTNWSAFTGFSGDILGIPLAAEGISAFFLESAFLGIVLFGRHRVSSTIRWISGLLVFVGTTMSAFWIVAANSWMQTPAGYRLFTDSNGVQRVQLTDFWAAVFNPSTLPRTMHTVASCVVVGSFFLMGVSAWYILRNRRSDVASLALRIAMVIAFLGAGSMFVTGDLQTREVQQYQPLKFAAMEGVFTTSRGVAMELMALPPNQDGPANAPSVAIPYGLSALSDLDPNGVILGLDQEPNKALWPPVALTFTSFHLMVALGALMMLVMMIGLFFLWRRTIEKQRWWLWAAVAAIPIPIVAVEVGWMTAEEGRQPWIVQGLMTTTQGVSPGVASTDVAISLGAILVIYTLLFALWLWALGREIRRGPDPEPSPAIAGGSGASSGPALPLQSGKETD